MKPFLLFLLLAPNLILSAQQMVDNSTSRTKKIARYGFSVNVLLPDNLAMKVVFAHKDQLDSVGIGKLMRQIKSDLQPLLDTLSRPLVTRRVYYTREENKPLYRLTEFQTSASKFNLEDGVLIAQKTANDTLRITIPRQIAHLGFRATMFPLIITLHAKTLQDVLNISPDVLDSAWAVLQRDIPSGTSGIENREVAGVYDVRQGKWLKRPESYKSSKRFSLNTYGHAGIQYARGSLAAIGGFGLQLEKITRWNDRNQFKLFWEPHFIFSRDANNKLQTDRNDFVTARLTHKPHDHDGFIAPAVSFGYLVHRQGEWYEKNTLKFSIAAVRYKALEIEPEFFFNDLFRNFSPSLKLMFVFADD